MLRYIVGVCRETCLWEPIAQEPSAGREWRRDGDVAGQDRLLTMKDVVLRPGAVLEVIVLPHHQRQDDGDQDCQDDERSSQDSHQGLDTDPAPRLLAGLQVCRCVGWCAGWCVGWCAGV